MSDESAADPFVNKYEAFYSMGNALYKSKQYRRAIWYYTQAINADASKFRPLIERSYCYLQLSKYDKALADIELAGSIKKKNPKIMLLHGEIYYHKGEFEKALIIFQRGKRIRSTIHEFQLGINKCEMCIMNSSSADNPQKIELNEDMDLTEFNEEAYPELKEQRLAKQKQKTQALQKRKLKADEPKKEDDDLPSKIPEIPYNKVTMRTLLEAQARDRKFTDDVYQIENHRLEFINTLKGAPPGVRKMKEDFSKGIQKETIESAVYLDNRTNFWYRQNPKKITDVNKRDKNENNQIEIVCVESLYPSFIDKIQAKLNIYD